MADDVNRLTRERDEARAWAWSLEHRYSNPEAMGVALNDDGTMVEPHWLSTPVPPWEPLLDAMLTDFSSTGYGTIYGPQVAGLKVGDCSWVTDKSEAEGDVTPAYVQVREVGPRFVRVQILKSPTDFLVVKDRVDDGPEGVTRVRPLGSHREEQH